MYDAERLFRFNDSDVAMDGNLGIDGWDISLALVWFCWVGCVSWHLRLYGTWEHGTTRLHCETEIDG